MVVVVAVVVVVVVVAVGVMMLVGTNAFVLARISMVAIVLEVRDLGTMAMISFVVCLIILFSNIQKLRGRQGGYIESFCEMRLSKIVQEIGVFCTQSTL